MKTPSRPGKYPLIPIVLTIITVVCLCTASARTEPIPHPRPITPIAPQSPKHLSLHPDDAIILTAAYWFKDDSEDTKPWVCTLTSQSEPASPYLITHLKNMGIRLENHTWPRPNPSDRWPANYFHLADDIHIDHLTPTRVNVTTHFFSGTADPSIVYEAIGAVRLSLHHAHWTIDPKHSHTQSGE